jgi:aspartyl-tRNA(Asn)/glutamyl-tRNA(Gln) amidotransferase subunit A
MIRLGPGPRVSCLLSRHVTHHRALHAGVSIAVKDNFNVAGFPCTANSTILDSYRSGFNATVVERLLQAGCKITEKTSMDEFGMGSFNTDVVNPWSRIAGEAVAAGGSSGGSAVAVANKNVFAALGSDTGGSVRMPASFCGIVGMKPTYGRLSRWGLLSYASSLDCPGIFANNVTDAAKVFRAIDGIDLKDPTSVASEPIFLGGPKRNDVDLRGMKIGIPQEFIIAEVFVFIVVVCCC